MEEVCEINSANEFSGWRTFLKGLFGLKDFSKCLLLYPVEKSLDMSMPKLDNFMQLFWTFVCVPVWPSRLSYVTGIRISTLLNLFLVKFLLFSLFYFFWPRAQNERNAYTNLNNCHNCFSCFAAIKIHVSVAIKINFKG